MAMTLGGRERRGNDIPVSEPSRGFLTLPNLAVTLRNRLLRRPGPAAWGHAAYRDAADSASCRAGALTGRVVQQTPGLYRPLQSALPRSG